MSTNIFFYLGVCHDSFVQVKLHNSYSHYGFNFGSMNCMQTKAVNILEVMTIHYS